MRLFFNKIHSAIWRFCSSLTWMGNCSTAGISEHPSTHVTSHLFFIIQFLKFAREVSLSIWNIFFHFGTNKQMRKLNYRAEEERKLYECDSDSIKWIESACDEYFFEPKKHCTHTCKSNEQIELVKIESNRTELIIDNKCIYCSFRLTWSLWLEIFISFHNNCLNVFEPLSLCLLLSFPLFQCVSPVQWQLYAVKPDCYFKNKWDCINLNCVYQNKWLLAPVSWQFSTGKADLAAI